MREQAEEEQKAKTEKNSKETLWHKVARWAKRLFALVVRWFKRLTVTEGTAGDMPKYHPKCAKSLLVVGGFVILAVCVVAGVWIAHGLGVMFSKWRACSQYYSDFLGGALGLTVGFGLDKFFIEKWGQITKYNNLIKIIKQELKFIQDNKFYEVRDKTKYLSMSDYEEKMHGKEKDVLIEVKTSDNEKLELWESDLEKDLIENKDWTIIKNYEPTNHTVEFIFDDIVRNAETMSVLANLPLAYEYSKELIIEFEFIQNYLDRLEYYLDRIDRQEGDKDENLKKAQIRWILMQYHLQRVL